MLVLKYTKIHPSSLAGHVDTLRTLMRILRRSKCQVKYSDGFNPHMSIYTSPALALGIESLCEYVAVDMSMIDDVLTKLNNVSPQGINFVKVWQVSSINIAAIVDSARYSLSCSGIGDYASQLAQADYSITFVQKGVSVTKQVAHQIHGVDTIDQDTVQLVVDCGNSTLRVDRIANQYIAINNLSCDYKVIKTNMFVSGVNLDDYIGELERK